jgi:predicted dinucleotide-binding enzyme
MKIGILGTGMVGQTLGDKFVQLGHEVFMGSRNSSNEKAREWASRNGQKALHGGFREAAAFGEIVFNCVKGEGTLSALEMMHLPKKSLQVFWSANWAGSQSSILE